ncbi:hypothetical protein PC9H_008400 [Pleurotus ostreatus]|uniref:Uncharacterized protein n=1 Tax=Pleurotus ostreatus TaxID=5322 RepID=A0A8H6ZNP0_PLEOS|nr:uncharacterized protein PC9H_008400 [Pleurotus ostreatus]KAF7426035.1 hypothetical protein PC9H_008400 [Pleurotus ostreatus]
MQARKRKLSTHSPRLDTIIQGEELATFCDKNDDEDEAIYDLYDPELFAGLPVVLQLIGRTVLMRRASLQ